MSSGSNDGGTGVGGPKGTPGATPPREAGGLAKWRGLWYVASWFEGRGKVALTKSRRMLGEGFELGARWPGRPEGIMVRVVPESEVESLVVMVLYRGVPVAVGSIDPDSQTLRIKLWTEPYLLGKNGEVVRLPFEQEGWELDRSDRSFVLRSPYLDVDDPRIEKVLGTTHG